MLVHLSLIPFSYFSCNINSSELDWCGWLVESGVLVAVILDKHSVP